VKLIWSEKKPIINCKFLIQLHRSAFSCSWCFFPTWHYIKLFWEGPRDMKNWCLFLTTLEEGRGVWSINQVFSKNIFKLPVCENSLLFKYTLKWAPPMEMEMTTSLMINSRYWSSQGWKSILYFVGRFYILQKTRRKLPCQESLRQVSVDKELHQSIWSANFLQEAGDYIDVIYRKESESSHQHGKSFHWT